MYRAYFTIKRSICTKLQSLSCFSMPDVLNSMFTEARWGATFMFPAKKLLKIIISMYCLWYLQKVTSTSISIQAIDREVQLGIANRNLHQTSMFRSPWQFLRTVTLINWNLWIILFYYFESTLSKFEASEYQIDQTQKPRLKKRNRHERHRNCGSKLEEG